MLAQPHRGLVLGCCHALQSSLPASALHYHHHTGSAKANGLESARAWSQEEDLETVHIFPVGDLMKGDKDYQHSNETLI